MAVYIGRRLLIGFDRLSAGAGSISKASIRKTKISLRCCSTAQADEIHMNESAESDSSAVDRHENVSNVSRLRPVLYRRYHSTEMAPLDNKYKQSLKYRRKMYAKFGAASGLEPGIIWPSSEEVDEMSNEEQEWEESLSVIMQKALQKKKDVENSKLTREKNIYAAMERMPQFISEYHRKRESAKDAVRQLQRKREKLIEEARDVLGYDVDPKDPRLQQLLAEKEEQAKRDVKAAKKAARQARTTARLLHHAGTQ